jgi:hypothetical protein
MALHNQRSAVRAISIANQSTFAVLADGALFRQYLANPAPLQFATRDRLADPRVGTGNPYDKKGAPNYFQPIGVPYSAPLNLGHAVRLLRMITGGAVTPTAMSAPNAAVYNHVIAMKAAGAAPLMANIIGINGGNEFLTAGQYVQTYEITQTNGEEPQVSSQMQNNGHNVRVSDTPIDAADIDDYLPSEDKKFRGNLTKVTFSDGVDSYDLAAENRQLSISITLNQNVIVKPLAGDLPNDAAAACDGAIASLVFIDVQSANATVKVYMDDAFDEFNAWKLNRTLTSVKFTFTGCETIGVSTTPQLEIEFPKAEFDLTPDSEDNFEAFTMQIKAIEGDATTGALWKVRVRTDEASIDD